MPTDYKYPGAPKDNESFWKREEWAKWVLITIVVTSINFIWNMLREPAEVKMPIAPDCGKPAVSQATVPEMPKVNADKPSQNTQFEYYQLLKNEVERVVPSTEIKSQIHAEQKGGAKTNTFVLQIGSFKTREEAQVLQSKMQTYAINVKVEMVTQGASSWYRVRTLPIASASAVKELQDKLSSYGINALVLKQ